MLSRREMLQTTAQWGLLANLPVVTSTTLAAENEGSLVNDQQSQLNATRVHRIIQPTSVDEIGAGIANAARAGRAISVAGGRHAMGGQQFGEGTLLLDITNFNQVVSFDREKGLIEVEAGIQWPELFEYLHQEQPNLENSWSVRQKQTGVDRVTIGGSLASNIHGRGLQYPPFISDIESFELLDAAGKSHTCSRRENSELFSLAVGGYGLFGIVTHVTLKLVPRLRVQRDVEVIAVKDLLTHIDRQLAEGALYGDCQYATFLTSDPGAHPGVVSCYKPVAADTPIDQKQRHLSQEEWIRLYRLARTDKQRAFDFYAKYYLGTSGQVYWSDTHQLSSVFKAYQQEVDAERGSEMITEVYVSKEAFVPFLAQVRQDFLEHQVDMTYGTIRFIEKDSESFLAWATEPSVCIVCNLHISNTEVGRRKAVQDFRRIIDRAIEFDGCYYLTYHRWATRSQLEKCYPQFVDFLRLKKKYDPDERFQSNWYRHYTKMFADVL